MRERGCPLPTAGGKRLSNRRLAGPDAHVASPQDCACPVGTAAHAQQPRGGRVQGTRVAAAAPAGAVRSRSACPEPACRAGLSSVGRGPRRSEALVVIPGCHPAYCTCPACLRVRQAPGPCPLRDEQGAGPARCGGRASSGPRPPGPAPSMLEFPVSLAALTLHCGPCTARLLAAGLLISPAASGPFSRVFTQHLPWPDHTPFAGILAPGSSLH